MAKKMYDIVPPKLAHKVERAIKELEGGNKKKRVRKTVTQKPIKQKVTVFPVRKWAIGAGVALALIVCIWLSVALPKVDVTISPKMDTVTLDSTITADKSATAINFDKKIIPARYLEVTKDESGDYPATGSATNDGYATGTITVYNKINPATSFSLKAGTHFLSDSGKYFITLDKVTVPAAKGSSAGSVSVKVKAESSGVDFNIGASKFSVPKLNGTEYYFTIWGESKSAMTGGYAGKVKKVTADDLSNAKDEVVKKTTSEAEELLKSKLGDDDVLLDGVISDIVTSATASAKEGTVADSFTQNASVKSSAFVVKKSDINAVVKNIITSNLSEGENYLEKNVETSYSVKTTDAKAGIIGVDLKVLVKKYSTITTLDLVELFKKKSSDGIKNAVKDKYGEKVSAVSVRFWPFWVTKSPDSGKKIHIELDFGS